MKKALKITKIVLIVIVAAAALYLGPVTVLEYHPDPVETVELPKSDKSLGMDKPLTVLSWNIGYGALSKTEDFFMDGGETVNCPSEELLMANMKGIEGILRENPADFTILQEVDKDSKRSFYLDEQAYLEEALQTDSMFAYNFNVFYTPFPLPTIGRVKSGLVTMTDYKPSYAERIALPVAFSWPIRTCQMKRCLLVSRYALQGTDKELVLVNLHLEAYDSGEGKIEQTKVVKEFLEKEYAKGNYIIAGGDFNQTFENVKEYEILDKEGWLPGRITSGDIPEHFSFAVADNLPTCRLLDKPYTGDYATSQVFIIDGFILSDNLKAEMVEVVDTDFEYTDHNPVKLVVSFQ